MFYGTTIKGKNGKLISVKVEELDAGWDSSNNITHTFSQELCELLNEQSAARNSMDKVIGDDVCEAGVLAGLPIGGTILTNWWFMLTYLECLHCRPWWHFHS